jgi:hypothetical protein
MTTEDSANTLPVKWDEELARAAVEVAATETPKLAKFSFRSGIFAYQGVAIPGNKLECIIVGSAFQHRLYKGSFDPDKPSTPVCFSLSLTGEDMAPSDASKEKQSETCESCESFKWGSAIKDGKPSRGKACKAGRRLILIPKSALKNGVAKAEMGMAEIPVTSVRGWANYVNTLSTQYRRPPWAMLTEVSVVPDLKTQFQVKFEPIGLVEDEHLGAVREKIAMANQVLLAPYEYSENAETNDEGPKKTRKF